MAQLLNEERSAIIEPLSNFQIIPQIFISPLHHHGETEFYFIVVTE